MEPIAMSTREATLEPAPQAATIQSCVPAASAALAFGGGRGGAGRRACPKWDLSRIDRQDDRYDRYAN